MIRFLYWVAGLRWGDVYTIALIVPERISEDPQWPILADAPREHR